jgi:hypothetical protein
MAKRNNKEIKREQEVASVLMGDTKRKVERMWAKHTVKPNPKSIRKETACLTPQEAKELADLFKRWDERHYREIYKGEPIPTRV